jgi:hypothetical protein
MVVRHTTRPVSAYVAMATRSPGVAAPRCPCPLVGESRPTDPWRGSPDARVHAHWFPREKVVKG